MNIRQVDPDALPLHAVITVQQRHQELETIPPPVAVNPDEQVTLTRRPVDARTGKRRRQPPPEDEMADEPVNAVTYTAGGQVDHLEPAAGTHQLDLSV